MRTFHLTVIAALLGSFFVVSRASAQDEDFTKAAQAFRRNGQPVTPVSDTTLICEAEEFQTDGNGWQAKTLGTNYYAATFANSFLSRKAYLGAPEQGETTSAKLDVVGAQGRRATWRWSRYEARYRFETQFRLVRSSRTARRCSIACTAPRDNVQDLGLQREAEEGGRLVVGRGRERRLGRPRRLGRSASRARRR